MLFYDRIDVSEDTDVNKKSGFKECIICHYWYLLQKWFNFQSAVCNGRHDVLIMSIDLNSIANINTHRLDYCCIINGISKSETINLFKNTDLKEKRGNYKIKTFSSYI